MPPKQAISPSINLVGNNPPAPSPSPPPPSQSAPAPPLPPEPKPPRRRGTLWLLTGLILLFGGAALIGYSQLDRYLKSFDSQQALTDYLIELGLLTSDGTLNTDRFQGEKGDQGDRGTQGEKGEPGQDATAGIAGPTGPQGPAGEQGPAGNDGADGEDGCAGGTCVDLQDATPGTQQTGHLNISGTGRFGDVIATTLQGAGSGITDLNAGNIATGTLNDARLSTNVALLDRNNQTFTGTNQLFQNSADSTTAFQVQNTAGDSILSVNTTGATVRVSGPNAITKTLAVSGGTGLSQLTISSGDDDARITLDSGIGSGDQPEILFTRDNTNIITLRAIPSGSFTATLPNETGTICLQSSTNCGFTTGTGAAFIQGGNSFGATAILGTNDAFDLQFETGGSTKMTIDTDGNVGIGDATPDLPLDILSGSTTAKLRVVQSASGGESLALGAGTLASTIAFSNTGDLWLGSQVDLTAVFGTSDADLVLTAGGNVGIGTVIPLSTLDVVGPSGVTAFTGTTNLGLTVRGSTSTNDYSGIDFTGGSGTNPKGRIALLSTTSGSSLVFGTSNNYASGITNTALTIDFAGNVSFTTLAAADNTTFLCRNSSNQLAGCSTTGTGAAFVQGGNSFGATAVLGTNDAFDLQFETGGTSRWRVTTAGHFVPVADDTYDIGSDALRVQDLYLGPATLHIGTSTTDEGTISYDTTGNILQFGTDATSGADIAFFTDDLYLDKSAGRVGIGTSSPGNTLHVEQAVDAGTLVKLNNTGTNQASGLEIDIGVTGTGAYALNAQSGGTSRLYVRADGNVGIGTLSPQAGLHVSNGLNGVVLIEDSNGDNQSRTSYKTASYNWSTGIHGAESGSYKISNSTGLGVNDYLTILTTGNVGIGTASPSSRLHVLSPDGANTSNYVATFENLDVSGGQSNGVLIKASTFGQGANTILRVENIATDPIFVIDGGNENIGINTASPSGLLHIVQDDVSTTAPGLLIDGDGQDLDHAFKVRTGADPATLTDADTALVVLGTGNVGIGTTSPTSFKLQVDGNLGPNSTNTYDLGSGAAIWNDIYTRFLLFGDGAGNNDTNLYRSAANILKTDDNFEGVNITADGGSLTAQNGGAVNIDTNTTPVTTAGMAKLYELSGELHVLDDTGNSTLLSPHDPEGYWVFSSKNQLTGHELLIENEKLLKELNSMLGGGYITEDGVELQPDGKQELIASNVSADTINVGGLAIIEKLKVNTEVTVPKLVVTDRVETLDLVVEGHIVGNGDTRGSLTVPAGQSQAVRTFTQAFASKPYVTLTPKQDVGNLRWWVEETITGFTVKLSAPAPSDLKFNYTVQE